MSKLAKARKVALDSGGNVFAGETFSFSLSLIKALHCDSHIIAGQNFGRTLVRHSAFLTSFYLEKQDIY